MPSAPGVRLTDRAIALILLATATIVLSALTMIALTAITVTGDGHAPADAAHSQR